MNKSKSIVAVIMVMIVTLIGFTSCKNNKCKDGEKCGKASCCKDAACCDKCSDNCTTENKCCDKCKVGEEMSCCTKDQKCCEKCTDKCTADKKCCEKCNMGEQKDCCSKDSKAAAGMYACPMHKDITSDMAAKCSKCGMEMEKSK